MTAINTNTAALNAQYYLAKSNKDMESSMAKLSSGQKVNSAADDAAGLAIASRMTSQIRGLRHLSPRTWVPGIVFSRFGPLE